MGYGQRTDIHPVVFLGNYTQPPKGLLPVLGTGIETTWVQSCVS